MLMAEQAEASGGAVNVIHYLMARLKGSMSQVVRTDSGSPGHFEEAILSIRNGLLSQMMKIMEGMVGRTDLDLGMERLRCSLESLDL